MNDDRDKMDLLIVTDYLEGPHGQWMDARIFEDMLVLRITEELTI